MLFSSCLAIFIIQLFRIINSLEKFENELIDGTSGEVWPLPWSVTTFDNLNHSINPATFQFTTQLTTCDILQQAIQRYKIWTFPGYTNFKGKFQNKATLTQANIQVTKGCDSGYPQMGMDESYKITLNPQSTTVYIIANEVWGALRGLESFSHLVFQGSDGQWYVRTTTLTDQPRFPHRGVMLDSARHFLSDLMAQNKFNVFHWHLVDSQSFPYASEKFPNLSAKGAFTPKHVYTQAQIKDIIDYARLRGIRVVPEFDTPGHTGGWGPGQAGLLATCYDKNNQTIGGNIIDPTKDENWDFLTGFFNEILHLFPDNYKHFGGDEVATDMLECWYRNPIVMSWMQAHGMGTNTTLLLNYYFQKLVNLVQTSRPNTTMVFWQEALDSGVAPSSSVAHVWKGGNYTDYMNEMAKVTQDGHYAIFSSSWYLNYIKYGADWGYVHGPNKLETGMYYEFDPTNFTGTNAQKKLVLGGEACLWGEYVDGTNLIARFWPRASAVAERLWSDPDQTKSADSAWPRLHEHRCRMLARGYPVQPPNGPSYCPNFWDPDYSNT